MKHSNIPIDDINYRYAHHHDKFFRMHTGCSSRIESIEENTAVIHFNMTPRLLEKPVHKIVKIASSRIHKFSEYLPRSVYKFKSHFIYSPGSTKYSYKVDNILSAQELEQILVRIRNSKPDPGKKDVLSVNGLLSNPEYFLKPRIHELQTAIDRLT